MKYHSSSVREAGSICLAAAVSVLVSACLAPAALGEERKFAVTLAVPRKQVEDPPPTDLPNPNDIYDQYFDLVKDDVESFAEYWDEISYGNVSISGHVFSWVDIPWPILPNGASSPPYDAIPFSDLNGNLMLSQFGGEVFVDDGSGAAQMYLIDYNGALLGTGTMPFPNPGWESDAIVTPSGLADTDTWGNPVWTPGERFLDLNGNGRYDAMLEGSMDGYHKEGPTGGCVKDGIIQGDEVCDLAYVEGDGDGQWDFPEPYEDFLVIYEPSAGGWIRLDPSYKNTDPPPWDRQWAEDYITFNYPGNVGTPVTGPGSGGAGTGFMGRFGNDQYDGPDAWVERGNTKMQRQPGASMDVFGLTTPLPVFGLYDWRFEIMGLVTHNQELEKRFGVGAHTISFPRLEPAFDEVGVVAAGF